MSALEGIALSLAESQALAEHGIILDTALVWVPADAIMDGDPPFVYYREDVKSWEVEPLCSAPTLSELLDVLEPRQSSVEKMIALAHALIALHDEAKP
jgi:hypothetical protein